ncbi:histone deacetylase 6 [Ambystoma mexicanum]|uniref:histone deacetylase 6 n=1 Tax=Ambystoma mexicanum TaxID=8296 RepID=UPI0037E9106A
MPSPSNQAQTAPRSVRASSRSPLVSDGVAGAPTQKKGLKKAGHSASTSQLRSQNLQETRKKGKMKLNRSSEDIVSQLQRLDLRRSEVVSTGTGLVCDERLADFHCLWDENFPECPARLMAVKEKLAQYGLTQRCIPVQARQAVDEEIMLVHSQEYLERMKSTQSMTKEELRALSDSYDSIYLHPKSYSSACLAAGSVLQLVDKVFAGEACNGMAVVRPPGHHAHWGKMNGYCMFNNIAMAARYAQQNHGASRILIVDWDVHHGQGTQYMFEDDPSVLYFSIHRYEQGHFWPHLPESGSHAVGEGRGEGFTVNVPWNKIGMSDADYIAAFLQLLLPIAHEFQPHLVLVAAGFDPVAGDPKGEMAASPACFAHLTHLLMPLAGGKIILALEGGYNLRSLAEGSCAALKILLGDPCPRLASPVVPCQSALTSISETIGSHYKYWKNLRHYGEVDVAQEEAVEQTGGDQGTPKDWDLMLDTTMAEVMRTLPSERTGLVYDERMMEHANSWDSHHPELPQRISRIYERHVELRLVERCCRLLARHASDEELQMCHSSEYIQTIGSTVDMKPRDLHRLGSEYNSIFINLKSYDSARLAAGSSFSAVEAVITGKVQNAVAIVRPPGHHAERGSACGFCFFNTAALAARHAQKIAGHLLKVMILDWDVHHGNGTQHIFEDDPSVLYVSLHRYDHATFFPTSTDADYDHVGHMSGSGFNVNIAWNNSKMRDAEYLMAFHRAVMPIAYEFNPDLVVVSAGFDAARGDPLGGCLVSPEGYAHMTHLLMGLAGGKVVMLLEGGYNLSSISESMTMCTRTLLGDNLPDLGKMRAPQRSAHQSVSNTIRVHKKYWKSLQLKVPDFIVTSEESAIKQSVTPSKNHTSAPSMPNNVSSSPVQETTYLETQKSHDTNEVEKSGVLLQLSQKIDTTIGLGSSHGEDKPEDSRLIRSPPGKGETILIFDQKHEVDSMMKLKEPMSPSQKPETAVENTNAPLSLLRVILEKEYKVDNEDKVDQLGESYVSFGALEKPLTMLNLKTDLEDEKATQQMDPMSPPGKSETTVRESEQENELEIDNELKENGYPPCFMPQLLKFESLTVQGKQSKVGQAENSKVSTSPLKKPEISLRIQKDHDADEALKDHILPLGQLDVPEETQVYQAEEPLAAARVMQSFPQQTSTLGAQKDLFEVCPAATEVSTLILQEPVETVVESAGVFAAGESRISKSQMEIVDHALVSGTASPLCQSEMKEPVAPIERKNNLEQGSLVKIPHRDVVNMRETKEPGKELANNNANVCLTMGEHPTQARYRKDISDALATDMNSLQLSTGEPKSVEHVCNLEQVCLSNEQGDSLVIKKDSFGNQSCDHRSPGHSTPLSAYRSPTSVPVGGARRKVKPSVVFSDSPTVACSDSASFASSSSLSSSSPTSHMAVLPDSPGLTFSTAPTTPASASPVATSPCSLSLTSSTFPAVPLPSSPSLDILTAHATSSLSSPSMASQLSSRSSHAIDRGSTVDLKGDPGDEALVETSLSLQDVDTNNHSQKESLEVCSSDSPRKDDLLEEAAGWTNPLMSQPLHQLFGNYPDESSAMLHAVIPLSWCPHLESIQPVPACGLNVKEACQDCGSTEENWVCLVCYEVYCGRYINEHMLMHGLSSGHMVVLSYSDLSVWCYSCESYVHNEVLSDAKNVAHLMKFGVDVA